MAAVAGAGQHPRRGRPPDPARRVLPPHGDRERPHARRLERALLPGPAPPAPAPPPPPPPPPPLTLARVRAQVASRLPAAPRFRRRLAFPPGGLAHPVWVDADGVHVPRHGAALAGHTQHALR